MSVINGTPGADVLNGTALGDQINGGGGDDVIRGFGGADTLDGGAGADRFIWNAGEGSDRVEGGADADTGFFTGNAFVISASAGHATVTNLGETVDLHGVEGLNLHGLTTGASFTVGDLSATDVRQVVIGLDAGANALALTGAATGDVFEVQILSGGTLRAFDSVNGVVQTTVASKLDAADQVTIDAGAGNDVIAIEASPGVVSPAPISAHGGAGNDTVTGSDGAERLFGDAQNDRLDGGGGADTLDGGAGNDTVSGGAGADLINWTALTSSDVVDGGADFDTFQAFAQSGAQLFANGSHATLAAESGTVDLNNVEHVVVSPAPDSNVTIGDMTGTGVTDVNVLFSNSSTQNLVTAEGGAGADHVIVSSSPHVTTVQGLAATLTLDGVFPEDRLVINTGAGDDVINARASTGLSSSSQHVIDGGVGFDTVEATAQGSDVLFANANTGQAILFGDGGFLETDNVERLSLHVEHDVTFSVGDLTGTALKELSLILEPHATSNGVLLSATDGDDTVTLVSNGDGVVTVGGLSATINISGLNPGEKLHFFLGNGNNRLTGSLDTTFETDIEAGRGNDTIIGGAGANTILGGAGNDNITGGLGRDTLNGSAGNDTISAGSGGSNISGGQGDDLLVGGAGNDFIGRDGVVEDTGRDLMLGGAGNDTFFFAVGGDTAGQATILDFTPHGQTGHDVIEIPTDFEAKSFDDAIAKHLIFDDFVGDVIIQSPTHGTMILQNVQLTSLNASDFIFH